MAHRWAMFMLLLTCAQGLRRRSKATPGPYTPPFDRNGCIGWECDYLDSTEFDFVVVGSGAGGGAAAARLADVGWSVLVLEAGADAGGKLEYQMPIKHAASTETPGLAWNYFIDHYKNVSQFAGGVDSKMTPKGVLYPRGGALGGSTAVNAMITVLPQVSDWERMAALTNDDGWAPSSMNKFESLLDDWLPKENIPLTELLADVFNPELGTLALARLVLFFDSAFEEMGESGSGGGGVVGKFKDYADFLKRNINDRLRKGDVEGIYGFPQMVRNGHRSGSRERLLEVINRGMDLTIKTQALVSRVVFSNAKAGGGCEGPCRAKEVIYLDGRGLYGAEMDPSPLSATPRNSRVRVREGGEIIISAGAFNTPQILKQSGIGPKEELERFDLPVHVDLVGVGENLQDRYEVVIESEVFGTVPLVNKGDPLPFVDPKDCNFAAESGDICYTDWSNKGKGLYATNGVQLSMLTRSGLTDVSDLHIFGLPGPFRGYYPSYSAQIPLPDTRNIFSWAILKGHTDNRGGTVKLRCAKKVRGKCVVDPRSTPEINFHYFAEGVEYDELSSKADSKGERDLMAVVRGIQLVRRINKKTDSKMTLSKTVETWPGEQFAPGEHFGSEEERLRAFVKRESWGHHASCSAPMGCIPQKEVGAHNAKAGVCQGNKFNANTVLDSRLRVRGTQGLRVADASAFPRIPGTFLLLPTFMLGEKAGAAIIEEHDE